LIRREMRLYIIGAATPEIIKEIRKRLERP
jgi:hypothetical protein